MSESNASGSQKKKPDQASKDKSKQQADDSSDEDSHDDPSIIENLRRLFLNSLKLGKKDDESEQVEKVLDQVNVDGIVNYIKSGKCKKIVAMVGAGISTSAGIPDFRSPGSGLYSNLAKYNLPSPECIFDINFFRENPEPFFQLAKELFPGKFDPTPCHYFLKLLLDKGLLLRLYTQNIDTLERVVGIDEEKLVEAHGTFYTSHCIKHSCNTEYTLTWMKEKIFSGEIPKCTKCNSTIKPDIIFFGERLPHRFFQLIESDFAQCDLLVIIGTSLTVQPFAGLVENVPKNTPRLLINKTAAGGQQSRMARLLGLNEGLDFYSEKNYRDVLWLGLCDDLCKEFAKKLGWEDQLESLIKQGNEKVESEEK